MNYIRPTVITDTILTSSDVTEADYAAYNAGTTYIAGDKCIVTTPNVHKIYESLANASLEVLTLDVAPATDWIADRTITGQTSGKKCTAVAKLTALTYLVKDRTGDFTLNEVIGVTGFAAELADQGAAKPTLAPAANVGHDPSTDLLLDTPLWWKEVSATNRWKVFDEKVGSQTSKTTSMNYVFTPGIIDSIAILNMDATSVDIVMTDPVEGEVYNETTNLISTVNVIDWYTYFFEPIIRAIDLVKSDLAEVNLPPYLLATLSVTITYTGGSAKCGEIIIGLKSNIGILKANPGPAAELTDYSTKSADDDGNYIITDRAYSKRLSGELIIKNTIIDEIFRQLALYRAKPLVWVGSETYTCFIVYGFAQYSKFLASSKDFTEFSLEVEGLT